MTGTGKPRERLVYVIAQPLQKPPNRWNAVATKMTTALGANQKTIQHCSFYGRKLPSWEPQKVRRSTHRSRSRR
ncbi:MAG: hypothetical protein ABSF36_07030 [Candidatus Methanomethylicaceae archaeon]